MPNEFLEAYFPLRIERYATVPDSDGAGKNRGGNGVEIVYCFLEPGEISIHDDRWFLPPWGVNGGEPAARSRKLLVRTDGTTQPLPAKCDCIAVQPGDLLHFITWGGAGWGDPLDRDPALVIKDVKRGLVTEEGARKYGVVVTGGGRVDAEATATLREAMRGSRCRCSTSAARWKSCAGPARPRRAWKPRCRRCSRPARPRLTRRFNRWKRCSGPGEQEEMGRFGAAKKGFTTDTRRKGETGGRLRVRIGLKG